MVLVLVLLVLVVLIGTAGCLNSEAVKSVGMTVWEQEGEKRVEK